MPGCTEASSSLAKIVCEMLDDGLDLDILGGVLDLSLFFKTIYNHINIKIRNRLVFSKAHNSDFERPVMKVPK